MSKKTRTPVVLMVAATILNSAAQLLYKNAISTNGFDLAGLLFHSTLVLGLLCYAGSGVFMLVALRQGEASTLYPIYTLSFIWIALGSMYFYGEHLSTLSVLGMVCIIGGIVLITSTMSEKKKTPPRKNMTRGVRT